MAVVAEPLDLCSCNDILGGYGVLEKEENTLGVLLLLPGYYAADFRRDYGVGPIFHFDWSRRQVFQATLAEPVDIDHAQSAPRDQDAQVAVA